MRTDSNRLDLDAFLEMGGIRVVTLLVREHGLAAEGVDESGPAWRDGTVVSTRVEMSTTAMDVLTRQASMCEAGRARLTSARGAAHHQAELDALLDILLPAEHLLLGEHFG